MSEVHFIVRSLNGRPSFSVEYYPARKIENNTAPVARFVLSEQEALLPMKDLIAAYAAGTLTKWQAPLAKAPEPQLPKGMKIDSP